MTVEQEAKGKVLVVDDEPRNVRLMEGILLTADYDVATAANGVEALAQVAADCPDVVLLDVMMPGMNGFEVCRQLKADDRTAFLPVVMATALSEVADRVRALEAGADDFLTKPVDEVELLARVKSSVRVKRLHEALQRSYEELQELERLRDSLVHMIVHDMRSPLTGIHGFLQLLDMMGEDKLTEKGMGYVGQAMGSTTTLIEMISSLLDVSKLEAGEMVLNRTECELGDLAREAAAKMDGLRGERRILVDLPAEPVRVQGDADLLARVFQNLLGNALKFTPEDGEIRVGVQPGEGAARAFVRDTGPGIPPEYRERIFEKFGQVEAQEHRQKHSTGLGLTFCKMAVEAHGGRVWVESEVGRGSTFWVSLPVAGDTVTRGQGDGVTGDG
jgi:signal transduction histidine kinase